MDASILYRDLTPGSSESEASTDDNTSSDSKQNTGVIAGAVVGSAVGICLILGAYFWGRRSRTVKVLDSPGAHGVRGKPELESSKAQGAVFGRGRESAGRETSQATQADPSELSGTLRDLELPTEVRSGSGPVVGCDTASSEPVYGAARAKCSRREPSELP